MLLPSSAKPEVNNSAATTSWGADKQILACMQKKGDRTRRLYVFDADGVKPPHLFPKFPAAWICDNVAWSTDGKKIVMSARPVDPPAKKANAAERPGQIHYGAGQNPYGD